ncbi:BnaAnng20630D [Brassica napus]|uniref:BnaAnng20630D protein n=1 Tax=Brassica napus TaxID=3708 RepID=A0A078JFS5_BRANA|nr:BnaAnng20630D [Brassica napus]
MLHLTCIQKTYGFITPEFWKETRFQKSPYQEYTDLLATKLDSAAKAVTEVEDQA